MQSLRAWLPLGRDSRARVHSTMPGPSVRLKGSKDTPTSSHATSSQAGRGLLAGLGARARGPADFGEGQWVTFNRLLSATSCKGPEALPGQQALEDPWA